VDQRNFHSADPPFCRRQFKIEKKVDLSAFLWYSAMPATGSQLTKNRQTFL